MSTSNSAQTGRLKTYGFLVAVEAGHPVSESIIEQAIGFYFNDSSLREAHVDVKALGEVDCYNEEGEPLG